MALGKAVVNITANLAPLKRGLASARLLLNTSLKRFAGNVLGGISRIISRTMSAIITTVKRAVAIISAALIAISVVSVKAASDMLEANNLFEVSFGKLTKEAEDWSKAFADSLKLNQTNIKGFIGTFNLMFTGMDIGAEKSFEMSKRLTELAIDMASLRNLKFEDAFIKIRAGIVGEAEPLRRLGILINDEVIKLKALEKGLIKQGEELTQNQKVMVRYDELLRQTARDTGDFARTMDEGNNVFKTFAEQVKSVKEAIGESLLPTVTRITLAMRNWLFKNKKEIGDWADVAVFKIEHFVASAQGKILSFIEIASMDGLSATIGDNIQKATDKIKEIFKENQPQLESFMVNLGLALGKALNAGVKKAFVENFKLQFTGPRVIADILAAEARVQRIRGTAAERGVPLQPALPFTRGAQRVGGLPN